MTGRRVAGGFLALLGAVGVTASAYLDWFAGRVPQSMPLDRLFQSGVTGEASSYWTSVALPLAIVTLLAVIGILLRSRLVLTVGWLVGLATLVLFLIQQAGDTIDFSAGDLQTGVWVALTGLIVMLVGFASMGSGPKPVVVEEPISVMQDEAVPPPAEPEPPTPTSLSDTSPELPRVPAEEPSAPQDPPPRPSA